jgi:hypothetical protein
MPRYRINELSFIGNKLVQPGDEIESDEKPGSHWEPLDKTAKTASKAAAEEEAARVEANRKEAEARALREAGEGMIPAPPQEQERLTAEAAAADAARQLAETQAAEQQTDQQS